MRLATTQVTSEENIEIEAINTAFLFPYVPKITYYFYLQIFIHKCYIFVMQINIATCNILLFIFKYFKLFIF